MTQKNFIHETAIVDKSVVIGKNVIIGPYCCIRGHVVIGDDCRLDAYCSIGSAPEHSKLLEKEEWYGVKIGDRCRISSFTTIDSGTEHDTSIGDDFLMLAHAHVGHDCVIENKVTLSCGSKIGGHTIICTGVNVGLNAVIHQRQFIGAWSMIGMGAVVTKNLEVWPGLIYSGCPAKAKGANTVGLRFHGITEESTLADSREFFKHYGLKR